MSVDYKAKIVIGAPIDASYQDVINEATNYKYEDWFCHADCYYESAPLFIGKTVKRVDAGNFTPFSPIESEDFDAIAETIYNILDKGGYPNPDEVYHNIGQYLMCEVS